MIQFAGHLRLRASAPGGARTVLAEQSFRAPFHLSKPYWDADTATLLVQVVNATAGILAGDRLESEIVVERNAGVFVTTPGASRVFRMASGAAECVQRFAVAAGGWLEMAPEPLVPHQGSRYRQSTRIDVQPGGGLCHVDQIMPGRLGHGEAWAWDALRLDLTVVHGGELVVRERFDFNGPALRALAEHAGSGPNACFANIVLIAPEAVGPPAWLPALTALHGGGVWIGASALRRAGWGIRIVASDPARLRATLRTTRAILAGTFPRLACDPRKP